MFRPSREFMVLILMIIGVVIFVPWVQEQIRQTRVPSSLRRSAWFVEIVPLVERDKITVRLDEFIREEIHWSLDVKSIIASEYSFRGAKRHEWKCKISDGNLNIITLEIDPVDDGYQKLTLYSEYLIYGSGLNMQNLQTQNQGYRNSEMGQVLTELHNPKYPYTVKKLDIMRHANKLVRDTN
jgi:hypothetical protein